MKTVIYQHKIFGVEHQYFDAQPQKYDAVTKYLEFIEIKVNVLNEYELPWYLLLTLV